MDILIKVIQLFLCFTLLVGIHELGHFLMARVFGIRVEKFYIFFDPWFSLFKFKRGGTEYGVGWLPLGGYVKIAGMIDESLDTEQMKQPVRPDEFRAKPAWQRFLVMIAGIVMNILLAVAIYCGICYTWGEKYFANEDAVYGYTFNTAAQGLGFENGDKIISIDGEPIDDVNAIAMTLLLTESDRTVVVERDGREERFTIPFEQLVDFRRSKGYEEMLMLRTPFRIDSVASPAALDAGLRAGDEVVALNGERHIEFAEYVGLLADHKSSDVQLTVVRGDSTAVLTVPVNADGKIGVTVARHDYRPAHEGVHLLAVDPRRHPAHGQRDRQLLGTAQTDRAAQNPDVRGAGRIHRHRQHLPLGVELAGFLVEVRLHFDHPGHHEHPAHSGAGRRPCDLHAVGDDHGTQTERPLPRSGAVRRTGDHPRAAGLRQRQRHLPLLHQITRILHRIFRPSSAPLRRPNGCRRHPY